MAKLTVGTEFRVKGEILPTCDYGKTYVIKKITTDKGIETYEFSQESDGLRQKVSVEFLDRYVTDAPHLHKIEVVKPNAKDTEEKCYYCNCIKTPKGYTADYLINLLWGYKSHPSCHSLAIEKKNKSPYRLYYSARMRAWNASSDRAIAKFNRGPLAVKFTVTFLPPSDEVTAMLRESNLLAN